MWGVGFYPFSGGQLPNEDPVQRQEADKDIQPQEPALNLAEEESTENHDS